jgi:gliding motility-associated-like protein
MKLSIFNILKLFLIGVLPLNLFSADWYVNDNSLLGDVFTGAMGNNANDGSAGSPFETLAFAIAQAADGDNIFVDAGTYDEHNIPLNKELNIQGAGYTLTFFDHNFGGTATDWFLYITANNVTLSNMVIMGFDNQGNQITGHSGQAITVEGASNLLIQDVMLNGNGQSGGNPAIVVMSNSSVTLRGGGSFCNTAGTAYTGGVEAYGDNINLLIEDYILGDNYKDGGFDGGGLRIEGDDATTIVTVNNSRIANNVAVNGGGVAMYNGVLNMNNCIVEGNVIGQASDPVMGGAVYISCGTATFNNCYFRGNTENASGTLRGGGISARYNGNTGDFSANRIISVTANFCIFENNSGDNGTDIYAANGFGNACNFTLNDCIFSSGATNIRSDGTSPASSVNVTYVGSEPSSAGNNISLIASAEAVFDLATIIPPYYTGACPNIVICNTPAPTGDATQAFCIGNAPTLANIVVVGDNVQWYDAPVNGNLLPNNTVLVDGTTYYATQTIGLCESLAKLAVTINNSSNGFGDFASAVQIANNSNPIIYNTTGAGADCINTDCSVLLGGTNFGSFDANSGDLTITAGEIKTFKTIGFICSASMSYRVYRVGDVPGSFTEINLPTIFECNAGVFADGFGPCSPNDQKWNDFGLDIDLTSGLCSGAYKLEVFYSYYGSDCIIDGSDCTSRKNIDNGGLFFVADFSINDFTAAIIDGQTNPTCTVATGSVVLSGLPTGNWTIQENTNNTTISGTTDPLDPTSLTTTFPNLAAGDYNFTIFNADNCPSIVSADVTIDAQPQTPITPTIDAINQTTCVSAFGSVDFNGLPSGNWIITETLNNTTISGNTATANFPNLGAGTYTFILTNDESCNSLPTVDVTINPQPQTPASPIIDGITQTTCSSALGSVDFSGLPAGEWIITESLTNTTITGNTESATFSDLPAGIYTFTVTNDEPCTSPATAQVTINNQPQTPNAPTIFETNQTTCASAVGSVELGNLPAGDWTITESLTNTTITGNTTTATFSDLPEGTYSFTVTNDEPCTSDATAQITINPQPQTPDAPIIDGVTQTTCFSAFGSVDFSGLPAGDWIITESLTNTTITGNTESATFGDLPPGIYTFTVTNDEPCTSPATAQITINSQPQTPNAPTIVETNQTTCTSALGSVEFSGLPAGNWIITETLSNTTITGNTTTASFTNLVVGTYSFFVTNNDGCTSPTTGNISINPQPQTPPAPTGNSPQIFCAEENATVADLEVNGNAIIWYTAAIGGIVIEPTVLLVNNGNYFASQTVGGCESTNRLAVLSQINSVVIDTISTKTPTCGLSDGFIEVLASGGDAPYTYTWNTGQSGELINSINNGTYTVTVIDMNSCVSNLSLSLSCEFSEIPEIITPNGNGENETWVIGLSEAFPQMDVKIYNRWGNKVFSASPYLDDWDGKANVGFKVGDEYLPSGTYFYIIDLKNGEKPKSGYIELVK